MDSPLQRQVLVLNRLWQPVNICSVRRAFVLLCLGHAQVVGTDEERNFECFDLPGWVDYSESIGEISGEMVRSVSSCLLVPKIIVLGIFDRLPRREVKFTRENVFRRDSFTCQYCVRRLDPKDLNIDHVIPRDKGGQNIWENVVCSCIRCNSRKGNKLPKEAAMFPKNPPRPPRWRPLLAGFGREVWDESWRHFLEPHPTEVTLTA